jgi:hypothetical protein
MRILVALPVPVLRPGRCTICRWFGACTCTLTKALEEDTVILVMNGMGIIEINYLPPVGRVAGLNLALLHCLSLSVTLIFFVKMNEFDWGKLSVSRCHTTPITHPKAGTVFRGKIPKINSVHI